MFWDHYLDHTLVFTRVYCCEHACLIKKWENAYVDNLVRERFHEHEPEWQINGIMHLK